MNIRMRFVACALCLLWLNGNSAHSQQLMVAQGVICDTQPAIEAFLALNNEAADLDLTVNVTERPGRCVRGMFHLAPLAVVGTAQNNEGLWSITRIMVMAKVERQVSSQLFLTALMPEIQIRFMAVRKQAQPT